MLLVEKDRIVRELLEVALARADRNLVAVSSMSAALHVANDGSAIDVALIETSLPDGSGLELGNRLKALDSTTEILLMSAAPSLEAVLEAIEGGATEYFPKPFEDINQLALRIGAAEERAKLRREGRWLHDALVESEERYRKLFAATPDAVVVFDKRTHRIEELNPAALQLYGYGRNDLLGQSIAELRGPENDGDPKLQQATRSDAGFTAGVLVRRDKHRDGTLIDVELVVGRFHVRGRDMVVEIIRDIGDRLREQQARGDLENQLRQSQKLEALGRLAGGVAHDFNNLLAVILNYANFVAASLGQLRSNEVIPVVLDDVEQIQRAATSATSLTRQLLAFSRREVVQADVVDVNAVISGTERLLRGTLGPGIDLDLQLAEDLARIRIDRGQLEQVLVNLVVNARDAMPQGGRLVIATRDVAGASAQTSAKSGSEDQVEISVSDSGTGIDPGILEKVFDPFFTTKDRERGTGLGLATVKGIVEHAGGCIAVDTELGVGSRFRVRLPVTEASFTRQPPSKHPSRRPANGELVLVVDDDNAVRRALCRILKGAGYRVVPAASSNQALAEYDRLGGAIDLILTDILMPGTSGEELVVCLRQKQPSLKVIFVTGYATTAVAEMGVDGEQRALLPKPFDERRLLEVVCQVLSSGGASDHEHPY
jgi:two-component system, cell cycle sensor histidine kinase and response regulator CckA